MRKVKTALLGLGTVNLGLLKILLNKEQELRNRYHLEFLITAVSDSTGIAIKSDGFDYTTLINLKAVGGKVNTLKEYLSGVSSVELPSHGEAELLVESSPVNLETGNPGLAAATAALKKGWNVVLANKAPLVFAFDALHHLAKQHTAKLAYSATVCGGLPVINVFQRDMKGASLTRFHGILNVTTNHILKALETGGTMKEAIQEAQRIGAAEADPMHDVWGHDTANKLYIIMKSFTGFSGSIQDIETEGIEHITAKQLADERQRGYTLKLIASAMPEGNTWKLSVKPTAVKVDSFLGQCEGWEMGIQFESDFYESIAMKIYEKDPLATSAAVLRDAIEVSMHKPMRG